MAFSLRTLIVAALTGAALPAFAADAQETPAAAPKAAVEASSLTPQILYQFLLAEIAAARNQMLIAAGAYADLAKQIPDVRIAKRASEMAYHSRQPELAMETTRRWLELDPSSPQARQTLWSLLASAGKTDELVAELGSALKGEGPGLGGALMQLNRLLSRTTDRSFVRLVIDRVTEPYLQIPEAHYARSVAAQNAQDDAAALREAEEALRLRPDWEAAFLMRLRLAPPAPEQGVVQLAEFLARNPAALDARLARARLLLDLKRYEDSRSEFNELLRRQPDNPEILYAVSLLSMELGDAASAEKHLRRLMVLGFSDMDGVRFYLAQIVEQNKQTGEAISLYDAVSAESKHYPLAQSRAADLLRSQGKLDEALAHVERAAEAAPRERVTLMLAEAQLLTEAGRLNEAYDVLARELALRPDEPQLLYESSMLAEKLGRFDVLEANLRKLIKLKPDYAHAYNALGYSYADRNLQLPEALSLIEKALGLAPDDPFILDSKGWVLFRMGDFGNAEKFLRQALDKRGSDPEITAHLVEVLWGAGRKDEANRLLDAAARKSADNAVLRSLRERLH
ncbi:MAG TPA: tetratricopeptide repeat protein [Rhodocyclaceae bacterium]